MAYKNGYQPSNIFLLYHLLPTRTRILLPAFICSNFNKLQMRPINFNYFVIFICLLTLEWEVKDLIFLHPMDSGSAVIEK